MKRWTTFLLFLAAIGLIGLNGCEDDGTTGPSMPTTTEEWIALGWSQYQVEDWDGCSDSFDEAYTLANADYWEAWEDSSYAAQTGDQELLEDAMARLALNLDYMKQILTGFGWLIIAVDVPEQGTYVFSEALNIDPDYTDALAGYAILLQTIESWEQSNQKVAALLAVDPNWVFQYNTDIDYLDLRLIYAENYYFTAEFELSLQEALAINDIIGYQPGLSADDFNLATIEGRTALITLIDELDDLI